MDINTEQSQTNTERPSIPTASLALSGLGRMYDPARHLFAQALEYRSGRPVLHGTSIRYTAISLLGLIKAHHAGWQEPLDIDEVLNGLITQVDHCHNIGDLGLILWGYALIPEDPPPFLWRTIRHHYSQLHVGDSLIRAIELQWLLTGLCYAYREWGYEPIEQLARQVYHALLGYYFHLKTGLFSCSSEEGGTRVKARPRQQLGFLAEQAYGIYALSVYAEVFQDTLAAEYAQLCASRLTSLQGNDGQWWWRYNVQTGQVANRYPLFPVHQEAVVPMALIKLEEVSGASFQREIQRGQRWIRESTRPSMIDWHEQVIWHDLRPRAPWNLLYYVNSFLSLLSGPTLKLSGHCVPSLTSCPQDLGWILYAQA